MNYAHVTDINCCKPHLKCVWLGLGDALMPDRSTQNWVPEPRPAPWWDNAFAIVIAVTIVMAAVLALFG